MKRSRTRQRGRKKMYKKLPFKSLTPGRHRPKWGIRMRLENPVGMSNRGTP